MNITYQCIPVLNCAAPAEKIERYGIPFLATENTSLYGSEVYIKADRQGRCLLLYGMTLPSGSIYAGNKLGTLVLTYEDGEEKNYDLTVGEALWWGDRFTVYNEPFIHNETCREVLWNSLRLYPQQPCTDKDGYILGIALPDKTLSLITFKASRGEIPIIRSLTIADETPPFLKAHLLPEAGVDVEERRGHMQKLRGLLYTTKESFPDSFAPSMPAGYAGPVFAFEGDKYAAFFTNVMHYNLMDSAGKLDGDGVAHTSSLGAPWYGYDGMGGMYNPDGRIYPDQKPGHYYAECWTRDLGRCLIELVRFGYMEHISDCLDWVFQSIRRWETDETLLWEGKYRLPRHVQRILQRFEPEVGHGCFENDGQAMISLAVWTYWRRLENRKAWAAERWEDIRALGDWYIWQFAHPEISRATDLLWSDTEASDWPFRVGASFYVDYLSMEALYALCEIAAAVGDGEAERAWRECADAMKIAIEKNYPGDTPEGRTWSRHAAWAGQTNLAHIILSCDRGVMNPRYNTPEWYDYDVVTGRINRQRYRVAAAMGYIQAFTMQGALLLDEMAEATRFYHDCAKMIYNPITSPYIVPESSIQIDDDAYTRMGDLGNCVQQSEILKVLRITVGLDDGGGRLQFVPRLPDGWTAVKVKDYPVFIQGKTVSLSAEYHCDGTSCRVHIAADSPLEGARVRLGGFKEKCPAAVKVNGSTAPIEAEDSGDRSWLWVDIPSGVCEVDVTAD